jgi:hypothetical protein
LRAISACHVVAAVEFRAFAWKWKREDSGVGYRIKMKRVQWFALAVAVAWVDGSAALAHHGGSTTRSIPWRSAHRD